MGKLTIILAALCACAAAQTPATSKDLPTLNPAIVNSNSGIAYLPKYVVSAGGGSIVPGSEHGIFAYYSASVYIGQQTYATMANEYTMTKGTVQTCPVAGASKILYSYGPLSLGTTGLAGACSNTPAGIIQGFGSYHFGKSAWSALVTATKPFTSGASQAVKISLGIQWGGS